MSKFARLERLPPYVFATVNEIKMEARRAGEDIIDLGMGNPDLGTPDHIVEKLIEAVQKPHNPTTEVVELEFFDKIVAYAKEHDILIIHDFAYADLVYDGYKAPSFLQAKGAKDIGVEFFSLSKSYSMPGWRVGFCVGNKEIIFALRRIKSYLDYGIFQPIQIASIIALNGPDDSVEQIRQTYKERRDTLIAGLNRSGWDIKSPKGTMFVWGKIPQQFEAMGSVEFSKFLIKEAQVAVSPGLGFGEYGDNYVRFALIENSMRINQAIRGIRKVL